MCMSAMDTTKFVGRYGHRSCRRAAILSKWRPKSNLTRNVIKLRQWKADVVRATTRKYRMFGRKRRACSRPSRFASCRGRAEALAGVESRVLGDVLPSGIMAPENTTQYLMCIVYDDLLKDRKDRVLTDCGEDGDVEFTCGGLRGKFYGDSLSPRSVYSYLDCAYESTLQFQQRDFEIMFPVYSGTA